MFYRNIQIVAILSLSVIGCATTPSNITYSSPAEGSWRTKVITQSGQSYSTGIMTFLDKTKATYTEKNGRILFDEIDAQGRWIGHWVEDGSGGCIDKKDGSKFWGEAIFKFNDTFTKFKGTWDHCGTSLKNSWTGYRR